MADLGWKHWSNLVGLRDDEHHRLQADPITETNGEMFDRPKAKKRRTRKDRWVVAYPLMAAGVCLPEVLEFWKAQPFDLRLAGPWEGNCDGCFLKSEAAIKRMQRDHPQRMEWWPEQEAVKRGTAGRGRTFRRDRPTYAKMAAAVRASPMLPMDETMIEGGEGCGQWCGV